VITSEYSPNVYFFQITCMTVTKQFGEGLRSSLKYGRAADKRMSATYRQIDTDKMAPLPLFHKAIYHQRFNSPFAN
jgi:hypothetical protein